MSHCSKDPSFSSKIHIWSVKSGNHLIGTFERPKFLAFARLNQQFHIEAENEVRWDYASSVFKDCEQSSHFQ